MELLRFTIRPDGTLGERWHEPEPEPATAGAPLGSALAALLGEDEDDEDWGGDAPDMSAEFARLGHLHEEARQPLLPPTADFAPGPDGGLTLLRWPRLARPAVVPDTVEVRPVTAIGATAFAAAHLEDRHFEDFYHSPISYSVFCMRMGRFCTTEEPDEGGPTSVRLPAGLTRIGPYAFWKCRNLTAVTVPGGVRELPAGVFGDCARLASVILPAGLRTLGFLPRPTDQVMPDTGVFAGCHALRQLTLPASVQALGAHTFNSAGLVRLTVLDPCRDGWSRAVAVAQTAFDHTAALLWLDKALPDGTVCCRLGLPAARDKILAGDRRFGAILRVPADFFSQPAGYFDRLAREAFRLDFSARMALARLECPGGLAPEDRQFYRELLVRYFGQAPQFMPSTEGAGPYAALFDFLSRLPDLTAADVSALARTAGGLGLPAELVNRMLELRTARFSTVTGFEDLDLD